MKIAYITVKIPYGKGETFIIPEIKEILRQGHKVLILPFRPDKDIFHRDAVELKEYTYKDRLVSAKILRIFIIELLRHPRRGLYTIINMLRKSRNLKILLKNITTIPKGFYAAYIFRREAVDYIHAHWASTPSSVAYIASSLSGIPWSFTAHRWDIDENNMLREKVTTASFVRSISKEGQDEIMALTGDSLQRKIFVVHMGVNLPATDVMPELSNGGFIVFCPANLLPKKGHKYLIEACRIVLDTGLKVKCLMAGDGLLESELKNLTTSLQLEDNVTFLGRLSLDDLTAMYANGDVDLVVLPSITTEKGEKEGIPVALMEAMAYRIPVISTDTGGIPELVEGAGIIVPQKDSEALAQAIITMMTDRSQYETYGHLGYRRIANEFDMAKNVRVLIEKMAGSLL